MKKSVNEESKEKSTMKSKHKNLLIEFNQLKKQLEETADARDMITRKYRQASAVTFNRDSSPGKTLEYLINKSKRPLNS